MAFTPTSAQLEQFKNLPKAQQQALAKQYGVDISVITGNSQQSNTVPEPQDTIGERKLQNEAQNNTNKPAKPAPIKPYGYELFAGEPTSFMPSETAAVPDTYIVGPGDQLKINFYGKESNSFNVTVDREGRLSIPDLTPVNVAGLTFAEIKQLIKAKVEQEVIGVQVFVSLGQLRSMRILVLGEAYKPGSYSVSSLTTVSHALFVSGGVSDIASLRNIQVKRAGKVVTTFDLYNLLINGDSSNDIILKPGDVVFVPSVGPQVTVEGLVKRPAIFELKQGETAKQLLKMAGGLKPGAYSKNATVERFSNEQKEVLTVDFSQNNINYIPQDGDRIRFNKISAQYKNSVKLIGAVVRPGNYQWVKGQRIADVLKSVRGDLLPHADLNYGLLVREMNVNGDISVYQFNVAQAITKNAQNNLTLNSNDKIIIFSEYEEKEAEQTADANSKSGNHQNESLDNITNEQANTKQLNATSYATNSRNNLLAPVIEKLKQQASTKQAIQLVEINGHVTYPGVYPLTINGNTAGLIAAAGGLLESAYTQQAEITRLAGNDSSRVEHVSFNLDNELSGEQANSITLQSKDTINIFAIPNWQEQVKVTLKGELKFPGTYTIRRGETLNDLLKRAGGFSAFAAQNAAVFTRQSIKEQEQAQIARLATELRRDLASKSFQNSISSSNLSYDEMDRLVNDLAKVKALGRLVIDLPLIANNEQTLVLQDGDALYVPSKRDSISVIGEVNYSTSHLYKTGVTLDDYLALSGGVKDRADEDKIYIIKANGSVVIPKQSNWFAVNNSNNLEAGDTIVVPLDSSHMDDLTLWSTATQILYQLGVAVVAITSI
nr:SLBB domain-containing protein [Pseudoalteromonas sp. MMG010]